MPAHSTADGEYTVLPVGAAHPAAAPLLAGLREEYRVRYADEGEMDLYDTTAFDPPRGLLLVVRRGDRTVAGGGLRFPAPGTAEVKRMWTHPRHRGRGLARWVLSLVEREAAQRGCRHLRLETGTAQPEAVALYESSGYAPTEPFGPWAHEPSARFYAKRLT